jgi:hypothetical protein
LYVSEVHLLVRPEINSFKDLQGKKVSFHAPGGGSSVTGPILFQRMGVKVEPVYIDNEIAYERMKTGEIAGLVFTVGKPNNLFTRNKNDHGFKFLPVPFDNFADLYLPTKLTPEDYPGYIKPGEKVETIGVQAVLAVYNWPRESDRFRRISRFIDAYFDNFDKFLSPPTTPVGKPSILRPTCAAGAATGWWMRNSKGLPRPGKRKRAAPICSCPASRRKRRNRIGPMSRSACSRSSWSGTRSSVGGRRRCHCHRRPRRDRVGCRESP